MKHASKKPKLKALLAKVSEANLPDGDPWAADELREPRVALSVAKHRRLVAAVDARIAHYARCRPQLRHVTADVLEAGLRVFKTEDGLVQWLTAPTWALNDKIPLTVIRQAKGRAQVVNILRALEHGVGL